MGVYEQIAELLEYPGSDLSPRVDACAAALGGADVAEAADALTRFREEAERLGAARLQELYTSAFDMDADCALYAGHHLFGGTARRSVFMACLAAEYRESGVGAGLEPPDYLPAMLRHVDRTVTDGAGVRDDLIVHAIVPAARRVLAALERRAHPYACVMRALVAVLDAEPVVRRAPAAPALPV